VERVGGLDGLGCAGGDDAGDEPGAVGGDVGQFRGPARAQGVEELPDGGLVAAGRGPYQQPGVVVHDDDQVLVPLR
jgi:hypothetical protein